MQESIVTAFPSLLTSRSPSAPSARVQKDGKAYVTVEQMHAYIDARLAAVVAAQSRGHSSPSIKQEEIDATEKCTRKSYTYSQKWRALKKEVRPAGVPARTY